MTAWSLVKTFLGDERGSHTLEFILWIPVFLFFLAVTIDLSMIYLTHTEMWNVARDTARRVVTGDLHAGAEAEDFAAESLLLYERARDDVANARYSVEVVEDPASERVVVRIATWAGEAGLFGIFSFLDREDDQIGPRLDATVTMRTGPPR